MPILNRAGRKCNLKLTLCSGQAFRWRQSPADDTIFHGVLGTCALQLQQLGDDVIWDCLTKTHIDRDCACESNLTAYLSLRPNDIDLKRFRDSWIAKSHIFDQVTNLSEGVRFLNQDAFEVFVSFICSQNSNIQRITSMVLSFAEQFGSSIELNPSKSHAWPSDFPTATFPSLDQTVSNPKFTDDYLRSLNFGYRGPHLAAAVQLLKLDTDYMRRTLQAATDFPPAAAMSPCAEGENFDPWPQSDHPSAATSMPTSFCVSSPENQAVLPPNDVVLELATRPEVRHIFHKTDYVPTALDVMRESIAQNLLTYEAAALFFSERYRGIGPKVADCICLYGLRALRAVPIDTRINQMLAAFFNDLYDAKTPPSKEKEARRNAFADTFEAPGFAQLYLYVASFSMLKSEGRKRRRPSDM